MAWTWRYENTDGATVSWADLPEAIFASQGDAESWLGENWRGLVEAGVDQVFLLEDERTEYGPMSLRPASWLFGKSITSPGVGGTSERGVTGPSYGRSALRAAGRAGRPGRVALDVVAEHIVDPAQQARVQLDPGRLGVLADLSGPGRADDGRRHVRVLQRPGHGPL